MTDRMLTAAIAYAARGWPVLPLHTWNGNGCTCGRRDCGSPAKHPRTRNGLKDATTDPDTIRSWWGRWPNTNVGLRTGIAFDVLDVDGDTGFDTVTAMENEHGPTPPGPTSLTGGGGCHRLFEVTGVGNRAGMLEHVDWRGKGGYIVAPPSLHASGNTYEWATDTDLGSEAALAHVDGWLHELLFPPKPDPAAFTLPRTGSTNPGDGAKYARKALDAEVGELLRTAEGGRNNQLNIAGFNMYQLAAGGEIDDQEITNVLTTAALGLGLTQREIDQTLRSAYDAGHASPRQAPALTVVDGTSAKIAQPAPALTPVEDEDDETTGWEPVDVPYLLTTDLSIPEPSLFQRSDGNHLIYAAKIHAFNGEPESGKSWAAQLAVAQALTAGQHCCYIDFEDSPQSVLGRLLALGASTTDLAERFTYLQPDRPFGPDAGAVLRNRFATHHPSLVIIDGVTEAMSTLGLEPLDNADTAKFFRALPRPLARLGAAVVLIDHVTKDTESRGRWAIGSQHKMAALTGAAYTIEIAKPFGRNKAGLAKLIVTKDRPGWIRQHAAGSLVAELHMHSSNDQLTAQLVAPAGDGDEPQRFTGYMERISKYLEKSQALTTTELKSVIKGRAEYVTIALRTLVSEGYVVAVKQGPTTYHSHVRAFREADEESAKQATQEATNDPI